MLPTALDKLSALLSRLPGVGERSANRLAVFILSQESDYAQGLGDTLQELHERVSFCRECHMLCEGDLAMYVVILPATKRHSVSFNQW